MFEALEDRRTETAATIDGTADFLNSYAYDAVGHVTQIEQTSQSGGATVADKRVDLSYNADGQFTSISRYADLSATELVADTSYTYDSDGRLTDLTHAQDTTTLADYTWTYDDAGRLSSVSSTDGTTDYTYDDTGQLTDADHSYQTDESYSYDDNGNRTNTGYDTGDNNQLLSDGTYDYEYDAEGNRTKRTNIATGDYTEYEWDHRNRLTAVTEKDANDTTISRVEYTYDVFDRRIAKDIDSDGDGNVDSGERLVYDGQSIVLSFDDSGSLTNRYLNGPVVDQVFASEDGAGDVLWPLADNQGTIRDIAAYDAVNDVTSVVNHIQYDSFGNITAETDPQTSQAPTQGSVLNGDFRFGFTGREYDPETGQYYYRHRYYDPATGRFDNEDPSGFAAGDANLQRYVFNSPTNFTDPSGLQVGSGGGGSSVLIPVELTPGLYGEFYNDWTGPVPLKLQKAVERFATPDTDGRDVLLFQVTDQLDEPWRSRADRAIQGQARKVIGWLESEGHTVNPDASGSRGAPRYIFPVKLDFEGGGRIFGTFGPTDRHDVGGHWGVWFGGRIPLNGPGRTRPFNPLNPLYQWNPFNPLGRPGEGR